MHLFLSDESGVEPVSKRCPWILIEDDLTTKKNPEEKLVFTMLEYSGYMDIYLGQPRGGRLMTLAYSNSTRVRINIIYTSVHTYADRQTNRQTDSTDE